MSRLETPSRLSPPGNYRVSERPLQGPQVWPSKRKYSKQLKNQIGCCRKAKALALPDFCAACWGARVGHSPSKLKCYRDTKVCFHRGPKAQSLFDDNVGEKRKEPSRTGREERSRVMLIPFRLRWQTGAEYQHLKCSWAAGVTTWDTLAGAPINSNLPQQHPAVTFARAKREQKGLRSDQPELLCADHNPTCIFMLG